MKHTLIAVLICITGTTYGQIPVEVFAGHEKTTLDIMFFRFFKTEEGKNSRWLFFNRNRASVDYQMTDTTFLPQFGFTAAVSYNHEYLLGFAPVVVGQVLSGGVYSKAGIQYTHVTKSLTVFSWLVGETSKDPRFDFFLLLRYTPKITEDMDLFVQAESVNTFPTAAKGSLVFTQRFRLGLQVKTFQLGVGSDLGQSGKRTYNFTYNIGGFVRNEF